MPSVAASPTRCAQCGHGVAADELVCSLCGNILRRAPSAAFDPGPTSPSWTSHAAPGAPPSPRSIDSPRVPDTSRDGRWTVLGIGVVLAPILTLTPLLQYVGWFLASLVHETGHTAMAWLLGCPAFPAIRLDGHAAALHREQQPILCVFVIAAILAFGWSTIRSRGSPLRIALAAALLVAYPIAAFTGVHEALFLLAGHLGELAFAAYAFSRALDGGFTGSTAERCAHAGVAWYLIGRIARLALGLLTSDVARDEYASNGSFGLENDLIRFSRDCLVTSSLAPGALLLLGLAVAIVVGAIVGAVRRPA